MRTLGSGLKINMIYLPEYFILTFSLFIHIDEFKSQVFRIRKYLFRIRGICNPEIRVRFRKAD